MESRYGFRKKVRSFFKSGMGGMKDGKLMEPERVSQDLGPDAQQPEPENEPMHVPMPLGGSISSSDDDAYGDTLGVYPCQTAATSFSSVADSVRHRPFTGSFGSDATDFDNITSPGAQAEHNPEYCRSVGINPYGHPAFAPGQGGLLQGHPGCDGVPPPGSPWVMPTYWPVWGAPYMAGPVMPPHLAGYPMPDSSAVAAAAAAAAAAAVAACGSAAGAGVPHGMPYAAGDPLRQGLGAAELHAHASELEGAAKQLLDMADSARAAALATSGAGLAAGGASPAPRLSSVSDAATVVAAASAAGDSTDPAAPAPIEEKRRSVYKVVADSVVEDHERTTVMLRNLPNDYTRDMMLDLLHAEGFKGCYDFLYVPIDFKRGVGLGYAFVNLVTVADAQRVFERLSGYTRWKVCSQKVLAVAWGEPLQGLAQHVERYKNSPLMHEDVLDEFKPMLFANGERIPFPEPTRRLRPPRGKCCATTTAAAPAKGGEIELKATAANLQ